MPEALFAGALFAELLNLLRPHAPGLRAAADSHLTRAEIRTSLSQALDIEAHDLSAPPRPEAWSVSISHTLGWGGWMATPRPTQIGWDVELRARIAPKLIARISTADERAEAPHAEFLWSAKEAFFKALEDDQPAVFAPVGIGQWRACANLTHAWQWQGFGPRNGHGYLLASPEWIMAAAMITV